MNLVMNYIVFSVESRTYCELNHQLSNLYEESRNYCESNDQLCFFLYGECRSYRESNNQLCRFSRESRSTMSQKKKISFVWGISELP